jgi:hypothetical protein
MGGRRSPLSRAFIGAICSGGKGGGKAQFLRTGVRHFAGKTAANGVALSAAILFAPTWGEILDDSTTR